MPYGRRVFFPARLVACYAKRKHPLIVQELEYIRLSEFVPQPLSMVRQRQLSPGLSAVERLHVESSLHIGSLVLRLMISQKADSLAWAIPHRMQFL